MNVPVIIYLRASKPYWFVLDPRRTETVPIVRIDDEPLKSEGIATLAGDRLSLPNFAPDSGKQYDIYQDSTLIVVAPSKGGILGPKDKDKIQFLRMFGNAYSEQLRNKTKSALIEQLSAPATAASTDSVLNAFRVYTVFDSVSAWLFNDHTNTFTRIAGDLTATREYVEASASNVLSAALNSDDVHLLPVNEKYDVPDTTSGHLRWSNIFRVCTTGSASAHTGISAVVCMYSQHPDYNLREPTRVLMRNFLQQHLAKRYFDRLMRLTSLRGHIRISINLENRAAFLNEVAKCICEDLGWEACSIFLKSDKDPQEIVLCAQYPPSSKEDPAKVRSYKLTSKGMTAEVIRENRILWSYDIENDRRNTHIVDDHTTSRPRNWIGVPVASGSLPPAGVLRVKNKVVASPEDDSDFSSLDMDILQTVASELASILHQTELFRERKALADQRQKELSELEDFLKTFRHEIRSPIQAVCFAPEIIGLLLKEELAVSADNVPKKLREFLVDFKATGNRLEMISKALTLNPEELVKDIQVYNLYKDCVAPVLAFAVPYAVAKRRRIVVDKDSLFVNMKFDAVSMSMAFHALVDNAIKYTDRGLQIRIFGRPVRGGHQVVVESRSDIFRLSDDDLAKIKGKYYRGDKAKEQKLEGSGIGLYLADKIMALHGGQLELVSSTKPVTFALTVPN